MNLAIYVYFRSYSAALISLLAANKCSIESQKERKDMAALAIKTAYW